MRPSRHVRKVRTKYGRKVKIINPTIMKRNKNKSYNQLKKEFHIHPLKDQDKDGKRNYEDCKPFDKRKQDLYWGREGEVYVSKAPLNKEHEDVFGHMQGYGDFNKTVKLRTGEHSTSPGYVQVTSAFDRDDFVDRVIDKQDNYNNFIYSLKEYRNRDGNPNAEVITMDGSKVGKVKDFLEEIDKEGEDEY